MTCRIQSDDTPITNAIGRLVDDGEPVRHAATPTPAAGGMVLEISSLFAMLIYALIAWAVERVIWLIFYRPRGPVVEVTQTTTNEHHTNTR